MGKLVAVVAASLLVFACAAQASVDLPTAAGVGATYTFNSSTNLSKVNGSTYTASGAFAADFDDSYWSIKTDGSGTSQRWYANTTVSCVDADTRAWNIWSLTLNAAAGEVITSVTLNAAIGGQIGTTTIGTALTIGVGYYDAAGNLVVLKELNGKNSSSATLSVAAGTTFTFDVTDAMTSVTLVGYLRPQNDICNIYTPDAPMSGTAVQFFRGSSTAADELQLGITTEAVPEPATMALLAMGGVAALIRRRRTA